MCFGPETAAIWKAIAATAAGTGLQAYNTNRTLHAQDAQIARGILQNRKEREGAAQRVNQQIASMAADTGERDRGQSLADFQEALRRDRGSIETGLDATLGGDRFVERAGDATVNLRTAGQEMADRLATITGLLQQRQREGNERGRTAVDLQGIERNIDMNDYLARLRAASERNNPWVDAAGGLLKAYGSALAMKPIGSSLNVNTIVDPAVGTIRPYDPMNMTRTLYS